jgi:hypothetical protein
MVMAKQGGMRVNLNNPIPEEYVRSPDKEKIDR